MLVKGATGHLSQLTYCGLVMPYGVHDLGQHSHSYWPIAWRQQAITWSSVDFSSMRCRGIHFRVNCTDAQIPENTSHISQNAPFCNRNVHMCAHFCYKMVHSGILVWCIVGFVRWVYCRKRYQSLKNVKRLHNLNETHFSQGLISPWVAASSHHIPPHICLDSGKEAPGY